jgi:HSP20 family protein
VIAEIPGIPREKLDVRVRGTAVEIRGESGTGTEEKDERYLHRERTYAGYYRVLELPEPVVGTDAKATVVNGLLELDLPKQNPAPSEEGIKVAVT